MLGTKNLLHWQFWWNRAPGVTLSKAKNEEVKTFYFFVTFKSYTGTICLRNHIISTNKYHS